MTHPRLAPYSNEAKQVAKRLSKNAEKITIRKLTQYYHCESFWKVWVIIQVESCEKVREHYYRVCHLFLRPPDWLYFGRSENGKFWVAEPQH